MLARTRTLVRRRSGSNVLALFGLTILLPGVLLTVFGVRALVQERRFAQQQIRERLDRTAQSAVHDLERDLHEWQAALDRIDPERVDDIGAGAAVFRGTTERRIWPQQQVLYQVVPPPATTEATPLDRALSEAESVELRAKDHPRAIVLYERALATAARDRRTPILHRLARTLRTALVAIVNDSFAWRYLAGRDPLSVKITFGFPDPRTTMFTVVGVVEDVKYVSLALPADPAFYVPQMQGGYLRQTVVVRTSLADPGAIAPTVRAAVKAMDPLLPIDFRLLSDMVSSSLGRQRLGMMLMLLFAATALALAAVGIYGVIAYTSAQRIGEVATRMALGATRGHVFRLMMRQGRTLTVTGTAVGLAAAYAAGRIVSNRLSTCAHPIH